MRSVNLKPVHRSEDVCDMRRMRHILYLVKLNSFLSVRTLMFSYLFLCTLLFFLVACKWHLPCVGLLCQMYCSLF